MNRFLRLLLSYKLVFWLAIPLLLLTAFSSSRQSAKKGERVRPKRIKVIISPQPDAPVSITAALADSSDPATPGITITLINTSNALIRAFTVRCDTHFGESTLSSWSLNNVLSLENCLGPQQTKKIAMDDANYSQPPQSAVLSVDFIEFLDGSRWGEDTYKSGERLDGWRAGAHSEAESLLAKIRVNGLDAFLDDVRTKSSDVMLPLNVSPEYSDGFRLGVDAARARVVHSGAGKKVSDIVRELQHPVDLSDRR